MVLTVLYVVLTVLYVPYSLDGGPHHAPHPLRGHQHPGKRERERESVSCNNCLCFTPVGVWGLHLLALSLSLSEAINMQKSSSFNPDFLDCLICAIFARWLTCMCHNCLMADMYVPYHMCHICSMADPTMHRTLSEAINIQATLILDLTVLYVPYSGLDCLTCAIFWP